MIIRLIINEISCKFIHMALIVNFTCHDRQQDGVATDNAKSTISRFLVASRRIIWACNNDKLPPNPIRRGNNNETSV